MVPSELLHTDGNYGKHYVEEDQLNDLSKVFSPHKPARLPA